MKRSRLLRESVPFYLILAVSFILILVLNVLTPLLSDDYSYLMEVQKAGSLLDLFAQEYHQYLTWNGRSVVHFILRFFLYLPRPVFKIANSVAFEITALALARLILPGEKKVREEPFAFLLVQLALWLFSVDFSETILWEDGACNYLWGSMLILGFMTCGKRVYETGEQELTPDGNVVKFRRCLFPAIGLFLYGMIAGWCNENTSGGCFLFFLFLLLCSLRDHKRPFVIAPLTAGTVGNAVGLAVMVLSPGEHLRASYDTDESYTGVLRYLARIQKITLTIRDYYAVLLAVLVVCLVILILQRNREAWNRSICYALLFLVTSYALTAARQTQPRAFFGAGLFLDIAVITAVLGILQFEKEHPHSGTGYILRAAGYGTVGVLLLVLFFHYVDDGTNLARVYRDENNRVAYIEEQAAEGKQEIDVFQIHPAFYNDFSAIRKMDMTEDSGYWINLFYEEYYGITDIHALPYDTWAEEVGIETES